MKNKLLEILEEFHSIYGHKIQEDLHEEYREFLAEKFVEYARSKVPKITTPTNIHHFSYNFCIDQINTSIDQDLQSLNN